MKHINTSQNRSVIGTLVLLFGCLFLANANATDELGIPSVEALLDDIEIQRLFVDQAMSSPSAADAAGAIWFAAIEGMNEDLLATALENALEKWPLSASVLEAAMYVCADLSAAQDDCSREFAERWILVEPNALVPHLWLSNSVNLADAELNAHYRAEAAVATGLLPQPMFRLIPILNAVDRQMNASHVASDLDLIWSTWEDELYAEGYYLDQLIGPLVTDCLPSVYPSCERLIENLTDPRHGLLATVLTRSMISQHASSSAISDSSHGIWDGELQDIVERLIEDMENMIADGADAETMMRCFVHFDSAGIDSWRAGPSCEYTNDGKEAE